MSRQITTSTPYPLDTLRLADPDTFQWISQRLRALDQPVPEQVLSILVDETLWGLTHEKGLALAVAGAIIDLSAQTTEEAIPTLIRLVHEAAFTGATLARIVATHLSPVLMTGPALLHKFQDLLTVMLTKGTYTLNTPLDLLSELLNEQIEAADPYIDLLIAVFKQPMSYNQSLGLVYQIPQAVRNFPFCRRAAQLRQFQRIVESGLNLVESFLEGMQKGLASLAAAQLERFVDQTIAKHRHDPASAANFLSLTSEIGREACAGLQTAATLPQIRQRLDRYLNARLGSPFNVKAITDGRWITQESPTWIGSDGQCMYVPEEIRFHDTVGRNADVYMTLIRIEAGFFECGSFSFDLERAADQYPVVQQWLQNHGLEINRRGADARRFFQGFSQAGLAEDLFMILELGRISLQMTQRYPGLRHCTAPDLDEEIRHLIDSDRWHHPLAGAYQRLVYTPLTGPIAEPPQDECTNTLSRIFAEHIDLQSHIEACAPILCLAFDKVWAGIQNKVCDYTPFPFPFDIRLRWDLIHAAMNAHVDQAGEICRRLTDKGLSVYPTDVQYQLLKNQGRITAREIKTIVTTRVRDTAPSPVMIELSDTQIEALIDPTAAASTADRNGNGAAFHYPEWDYRVQDYLQSYTRVQEIALPSGHSEAFYQQTLTRHGGLVAQMRRTFEWLKPEGLSMLRQWPEGDAFDYRALLDFAVDRRTGRIPSDRLYIKRLKKERDVAVLVLVDLSRSTANAVIGRQNSVLDLTKEALVLFCEALEVVGDQYALAGFSGTGRHRVDYYPIKEFHEPLDRSIQKRISALCPQRSTRMGAAIRHGAGRLGQAVARVRLMLIISDGFPNDLGYKAEYAIKDTRKAVQEARSLGLYLKAVTVNIGRDPKLDELYGRSNSHVIEDVGDLPGKLLRLYGTLTRPY